MLTLQSKAERKLRYIICLIGIRMEIDTSKPDEERITSLKVRCSDCVRIVYEDLDDYKTYNVTTIEYLAAGGNGFDFLPGEIIRKV